MTKNEKWDDMRCDKLCVATHPFGATSSQRINLVPQVGNSLSVLLGEDLVGGSGPDDPDE